MGLVRDLPDCPSPTTRRIWRVSLTRNIVRIVTITIHCNGEELTKFTVAGDTCDYSTWMEQWGRGVAKIEFKVHDSATDFYRKYSGK